MAERLIGLAIDELFAGDHNSAAIVPFLEGFSQAIHSGEGRKTAALTNLGVDIDFPLRILLGVPKVSLTREQRLLAEAYCSLHFRLPFGGAAKVWTTKPGWKPVNPRRVEAPLAECTLAVDWMLQLGISRFQWDQHVLKSDGALDRAERGRLPAGTATRHLLLLSIFGFQDPLQFFTTDRRPRTREINGE